ncbi:hypothetical protein A2U01_0078882, partial [Trifolium medium]|nr:hypothetical protein [Trifolium medium]
LMGAGRAYEQEHFLLRWAQAHGRGEHCARRRLMGAGRTYELDRFDFADFLEKLVSWRAL